MQWTVLTVLQTSFKKLVKLSLLLRLLPKSFVASHFSNKKGKDEFVSLTVFSPKISQLWFQLTYNYNYIWAKIELSKHFLSTFQFNQHLWPGCWGIIITRTKLCKISPETRLGREHFQLCRTWETRPEQRECILCLGFLLFSCHS